MLDRLGFVEIDWLAHDDERDHSHRIMRLALDAVNAGNVEGDGDVPADLTGKRLGALRQHAIDAHRIVPLGQRDEVNAVARSSEEHTSELQPLMRISSAVLCSTK